MRSPTEFAVPAPQAGPLNGKIDIFSPSSPMPEPMRFTHSTFVLLVLSATAARADSGPAPDFDRDVAGIFASRCFDCHNPTEHKGKLDLTRRESAMKGGKDGVVIVPGKPDESLLWKHVAENEMPPKRPLPDAEKKVLERWVASGAKWGS